MKTYMAAARMSMVDYGKTHAHDCFMSIQFAVGLIVQCFSTSVRPRLGKFFFHKTRARSQQIYS